MAVTTADHSAGTLLAVSDVIQRRKRKTAARQKTVHPIHHPIDDAGCPAAGCRTARPAVYAATTSPGTSLVAASVHLERSSGAGPVARAALRVAAWFACSSIRSGAFLTGLLPKIKI